MKRLESWLQHLPAPRYPYPIDAKLARDGATLFQQKCAECHEGKRTGTVIPHAEVGTDRHRLGMWSQEAADIYNRYPPNESWKFQRFQKHDGFIAVPLDGLWMRAPYLHNGSVPTLEALLEPAAKRPAIFYRGYDVVDRKSAGFVHTGPDAEREGFKYDTAIKGNSNAGHEGPAYGTDLTVEQKRALVEYLKTQ